MDITTLLRQPPDATVLLTINQRLSRHLIKEALTYQDTPRAFAIYPIDTWIKTQVQLNPESPTLLTPSQERQLWQQTGLTQASSIEDVQRAWQLIHDYALSLDTLSTYPARSTHQFIKRAQQFQRLCQAGGWITRAELPAYLTQHLSATDWQDFSFYTVGFHTIEPATQALIKAIAAQTGRPVTPLAYGQTTSATPDRQVHAANDERSEINDMVHWAITTHQENPAARIACVVPNLAAVRDTIDFALKEAGADFSHINISGAEPLSSFPLIAHAIEQLSLLADESNETTWSQLLHTPCFYATATAHHAGMALDCLRAEKNLRYPTLTTMRALIQEDTHPLSPQLDKLIAHQTTIAAPRRLKAWITWSYELLQSTGWPGYRTLNSTEHQLVSHFSAHLANLATLDTWVGEINYTDYLALLREETQRAPFQAQSSGDRIQILGLLEASDLPFDSLWITHLSASHFPPAARPNPLLPIALQQQYDMPHASPEKEYAFAHELLTRLCQQAECTRLSYAAHEDSLPAEPSPLIRHFPPLTPPASPPMPKITNGLTHLIDHTAPPLQAEENPRGGTRIISNQMACPFKAMVESRLHARAIPSTDIGIPAKEKGIWVHQLMQRLWEQIQSHQHLVALSESELAAQIQTTINTLFPRNLEAEHSHTLEKERLFTLAKNWLALESKRTPFTVLSHETPVTIEMGKLSFTGRIDRIDQLDSGDIMLIDYKTGLTATQGWTTTPPTDPQLPLYALYSPQAVNQIAFAQVRTGALALKCFPEEATPSVFETHKTTWRITLDAVGKAFESGVAHIAPSSSACRHCDLKTVCKGHVS